MTTTIDIIESVRVSVNNIQRELEIAGIGDKEPGIGVALLLHGLDNHAHGIAESIAKVIRNENVRLHHAESTGIVDRDNGAEYSTVI